MARMYLLLLQLAGFVHVEAEIMLELLNHLLFFIQVLVVLLGLSLQSLVDLHKIVIEEDKLLHFG